MSATDFLPWMPSLLTLLGWFLVNHQNNTREQRKEMRAAADQCKNLAREGVELGMKYWVGDEDTHAWQVKAALDELEVEICRFPDHKGRIKLLEHHADLLDAITGSDFESVTRKVRPATDPLMRNVAKVRQRILHEIENQFQTHYN